MRETQHKLTRSRGLASTTVAMVALLSVVIVCERGVAAAEGRPQVPTASYNTEGDAALAKEIVRMAEAEKRKDKRPFDHYWVAVDAHRDAGNRMKRLETNAGYVIGITDDNDEDRYVIPARKILYVVVRFKGKK